MISPGYATEILQKFAFWFVIRSKVLLAWYHASTTYRLDLHEVHVVIRASPEAREAIDASMQDVESGVAHLQDMYEAVRAFR